MDEPEVYAFLPIAFFLILIISFLQTSKHYFLYFYSFKSVSWIPISLWFDNLLHYYIIHPSSKLTRHQYAPSCVAITWTVNHNRGRFAQHQRDGSVTMLKSNGPNSISKDALRDGGCSWLINCTTQEYLVNVGQDSLFNRLNEGHNW